jgi:hypothetical protein
MLKLLSNPRFLAVYSGILTLAFIAAVFAGVTRGGPFRARELTVERINIVEPDGTLRMVISGKTRFPGLVLHGKEYPHPNRKTAGMLFFNDEATENGGLIFGGMKDKDGKTSSYGHLSFDRYDQDQTLVLDAIEEGDVRRSRISIVDQPEYPIQELLALLERTKDLPADQRKAEQKKFLEARGGSHARLFLGRSDDRSVSLRLNDADGRERLVIAVAADGTPEIKFLDPEGKVIAQLPARGANK